MDRAASRATLLVVDDDEANLDLMIGLLDDYDLIPVTSGTEALTVIDSERVDLVLLDIVMPGMDGIEVCARLRADERTCRLPVIFITGKDDERTLEDAYLAGAYDFVTKPIRAIEVRARVQTQLTLAQQYNQLRQFNVDLCRAHSEVARSKARYELALDTALDGYCVLDRAGVILDVNRAYCRMSGYSREELVGAPLERIESAGEQLRGTLQRIRLDGRHRYETRHVRKDGRPLLLEASVSYSDTEGGRYFWFARENRDHQRTQAVGNLRARLAEQIENTDVPDLMRITLESAIQSTQARLGSFVLSVADPGGGGLQRRVCSGLNASPLCEGSGCLTATQQSSQGAWRNCVLSRIRPVNDGAVRFLTSSGETAAGAAPVSFQQISVIRDGRTVAMLEMAGSDFEFDEPDQDFLRHLAEIGYDFIRRREAELRVEALAYHDGLTGLPNRVLLYDRLQQVIAQCRRNGRFAAICFLDLDEFKPVNDSFGHHVGDELLRQVSSRLLANLRDGDTLARLGGDEFVLVLSGLGTIADGEEIIGRLLRSMNAPFEVGQHQLSVSGSIGATFYPNDNADPDTLMRHADQAMYQAKSAGRSTWRVFDPLSMSGKPRSLA